MSRGGGGASRGDYPAAKKVASSNKEQAPGVDHPQTGQFVTPYKVRCACGGITGIPGTKWGNSAYASHEQTKQHLDWSKASSAASSSEN